MASRLKNIVPFSGLAVGVATPIAHSLNQEGRGALVPDVVFPDVGGLVVTADATNITVTRPTVSDPAAVSILVEAWHTIEREFGFPNSAPFSATPTGPQPIVINQAAGGTATTDWKNSVRVAGTAIDGNIDLGVGTLLTIDGVGPLVAGDRVLVKNQTLPAENGIYTAAVGAWTRAADANTSDEVTSGFAVHVSEGTTQEGSTWVLRTPDPITLDTTALTFEPFLSSPQFAITAVQTGAFTADLGQVVRCDPTGGVFTVTLPVIAPANQGGTIIVKNSSASTNIITIARASTDTIDGATSATIAVARGSLTLVSDGIGNWDIV